jgi:hypothetical protein
MHVYIYKDNYSYIYKYLYLYCVSQEKNDMDDHTPNPTFQPTARTSRAWPNQKKIHRTSVTTDTVLVPQVTRLGY